MPVKSKRIRHVSVQDMNKHLEYCSKFRVIIEDERHHDRYQIANLIIKKTQIELTYRKGGQTTTYISKIDGQEASDVICGWQALQQVAKYYKLPRLQGQYGYYVDETTGKVTWAINAARALLWYNPKYNHTRTEHCYCYDLNSSYSYAMLKPMPDTSVKAHAGMVKSGEIGFKANGQVVFSGHAMFIFPLIPSPFKPFVDHWFEIKSQNKGLKKVRAKNMLVYSVGYFQRVNVFLRSAIIHYANEFVENLKDDDTLYINTDSITSKVRRPDIEEMLGDGLGQWKIEDQGSFAYNGYSYQWNNELPSIRGVSQGWLENWVKRNGRPYDILIDEIPFVECNDYEPKKIRNNYYKLERINYEFNRIEQDQQRDGRATEEIDC